ncbi:GntR family transcriptional regulator [Aureimonas frigidaquae]|uniref:GntR family transcriptional regulator n=1 Tax=Aureimonas frigidaquae TaxID=424757 RepID=UPI000781337A|nr:GntR family transcriptional regulator [Aureimonas frigidaquae]
MGKATVTPDPVVRLTLKDTVYEKLRDLILNGGIEPGKSVTIQSLADAFGVSPMPIREILHRLVAEKALTLIEGRSVGIPRLTVDRLADLRRVRVELESIATGWAIRHLNASDFQQLSEAIDRMDAAIAQGDRAGYVSANRAFHFTIYNCGGSPSLLSIIETLWLQIGPYFSLLDTSGNWSMANGHHRDLRDALMRKDVRAARRALQADIEGGMGVLHEMLLERRRTLGA